MSLPEQLVSYGSVYLMIGACIALLFVTFGVARVEPSAKGGSLLFRLLIVPGATLLWPLIATRWIRAFMRRPA
jgi:hypothetical protein